MLQAFSSTTFLHLCAFISRFIYIATCTFDTSKENKYLPTYLLTYLLTCVCETSSQQCIGSGVIHWIQCFRFRKQSPWSWRIFFKQIRNSSISKNKRNFFSDFSPSPTSVLRIILRRHVVYRKVLSTVDRRHIELFWVLLANDLSGDHTSRFQAPTGNIFHANRLQRLTDMTLIISNCFTGSTSLETQR